MKWCKVLICLYVKHKKLQLCRKSIVLGTFTPTSLKFVDLSHHAQSWLDALKALQPLAAKNGRRCSLIWWRWQTKQWKWHAIVFFPQLFCFANSRICAYFKVNVNNIALFCGNCVCSKVKTKGKMKFPFISARARARTIAPDPPFSNTTLTRSFQSEMDSRSTQPIFKIKTDSVREKAHL